MNNKSKLDIIVKIREIWIFIVSIIPLTFAVYYIYVVPKMIDLMSKEMWVLAALFLLTVLIFILIIIVFKIIKQRKIKNSKKITSL